MIEGGGEGGGAQWGNVCVVSDGVRGVESTTARAVRDSTRKSIVHSRSKCSRSGET